MHFVKYLYTEALIRFWDFIIYQSSLQELCCWNRCNIQHLLIA